MLTSKAWVPLLASFLLITLPQAPSLFLLQRSSPRRFSSVSLSRQMEAAALCAEPGTYALAFGVKPLSRGVISGVRYQISSSSPEAAVVFALAVVPVLREEAESSPVPASVVEGAAVPSTELAEAMATVAFALAAVMERAAVFALAPAAAPEDAAVSALSPAAAPEEAAVFALSPVTVREGASVFALTLVTEAVSVSTRSALL